MDTVFIRGKMVRNMKDNTQKTKKMVKVYCLGLMGGNLRGMEGR